MYFSLLVIINNLSEFISYTVLNLNILVLYF